MQLLHPPIASRKEKVHFDRLLGVISNCLRWGKFTSKVQ